MKGQFKSRQTALRLAAALGAALAAGAAAAAAPDDPGRALRDGSHAAAAYLAASCSNCHGTHGQARGAMPSIAGVAREHLAQQLRAFRDGRRDATVMHQLAKGYSDEQIDALAEHFARQGPRR